MKRYSLCADVLVALALTIATGCKLEVGFPQFQTNGAVATSDIRLEEEFTHSLAANVDLNAGVTLIAPTKGIPVGGGSGPTNDITYIVLNHTDETIVFPDQAFGLVAYWADSTTGKWQTIELPVHPDPTPKSLPPRLERLDSAANNMWGIYPSDFPTLDHLQIRLYVEGVGATTGKKYGAYLDVMLRP